MLKPLRASIYAFKTDFVMAGWIARLQPRKLRVLPPISRLPAIGDPPSAISTIRRWMRNCAARRSDVLMDLRAAQFRDGRFLPAARSTIRG